ncbi:MAG: hypothetical protein ABIY70_28065 [Capsulimonas sp.]|uniref:hypothetical protein n=1 Tax=Capsulimonas sp. TaxID=2494211 RepID=UPI0032642939
MTIQLNVTPELGERLQREAEMHGQDTAAYALQIIAEHFTTATTQLQPEDEWERQLVSFNWGGNHLLAEKLTREFIYE